MTSSIEHLPAWLPDSLRPTNDDLDVRVVLSGDQAHFLPTGFAGCSVRVFDYVDRSLFWISGELLLRPEARRFDLASDSGLELYLHCGSLDGSEGLLPEGYYLRLPPTVSPSSQQAELSQVIASGRRARCYFTLGQLLPTDTETRRIDTRKAATWLPGPVNGIEVLPLHGHGNQVSMLVRWRARATFQPRIDPQGEEVLVLQGQVGDAWGEYGQHSWIRNPVSAWQAWRGGAGTMIYYKSGHLADDAA